MSNVISDLVQTLFAAGFFNFQPSGNTLVSSWIWVYVVTTVALSAIVMLIWFLLNRSRNKEMARVLHLPHAQLFEAMMDEENAAATGTPGNASVTGVQRAERLETMADLRKRLAFFSNA